MPTVQYAQISQIKPLLDRESDKEGFNKLKESIRKNGVLQPIHLRAILQKKRGKKKRRARPGDKMYAWEHVDGHRRRRACEELGIKDIPFILKPLSDKEQVETFYIENEVRSDLSAYEKAALMQRDTKRMSLRELADKYDMTLVYVRQCLSTLEEASPELNKAMSRGELTLDEGRYISRLTKREQPAVMEHIQKRGLKGRRIRDTIAAHKQTDDRPTTGPSIRHRIREAVKENARAKDDREQAYGRYQLIVEPLLQLLEKPEFRKALKKARINYSAFWSD